MKRILAMLCLMLSFYGCIPEAQDEPSVDRITMSILNTSAESDITIDTSQYLACDRGVIRASILKKGDSSYIPIESVALSLGYSYQEHLGTIELNVSESENLDYLYQNLDTTFYRMGYIRSINGPQLIIAMSQFNGNDYTVEYELSETDCVERDNLYPGAPIWAIVSSHLKLPGSMNEWELNKPPIYRISKIFECKTYSDTAEIITIEGLNKELDSLCYEEAYYLRAEDMVDIFNCSLEYMESYIYISKETRLPQ